jgi:hypothetical protein
VIKNGSAISSYLCLAVDLGILPGLPGVSQLIGIDFAYSAGVLLRRLKLMSLPAQFMLICLMSGSFASFALTVEEVDIFGDPNPVPVYQIVRACDARSICFKRDFYRVPNQPIWVDIKLELDTQFKPVRMVENGQVRWTSRNSELRGMVLPKLEAFENYSIDLWATGPGDQLNTDVTGPIAEPGSTLFAARLSIDSKQWASTTRHFYVVGRILDDRIKILGISDYEGLFESFFVEDREVLLQALKTMWKREFLPKNDRDTLDKYMRRSGAFTVPYAREK